MTKKSVCGLVVAIIVLLYSYSCYLLIKAPEKPNLEEIWWGEGDKGSDDENIRPFKIRISKEDLQNLKLRLNISRPPTPSLERTQHEYGINPQILKDVLKIIEIQYNFTERQEFLNQYPQFTTQIQGLDIHFLHVVPDNPKNVPVLPMLLLHGWPGSVRNYYDMIPALTAKTNQSFLFELVIPALPGFGYSSAPRKPNCQAYHVAQIFVSLMKRLKHQKFYVHGGDWGAIVAAHLATLFPEVVLGFHSNFCVSLRYISLVKILLGSLYPPLLVPKEFEKSLYPLFDLLRFYFAESGYLHIQGTKPDTVGVALDNSVEGLLAFTLEKLSVGSNKRNIHLANAGLDKFNMTTLLDVLLFYYWFPQTATTSARFYTENLKMGAFEVGVHNIPISEEVPCGCTLFENEFIYQPESILRDKFTNLIHYTTYKLSGHFATLEDSDSLVRDIISFVSKTAQ